MKVLFLKVGDIRTVEEDFKSDILLQCRWREKKLDKTHRGVGASYCSDSMGGEGWGWGGGGGRGGVDGDQDTHKAARVGEEVEGGWGRRYVEIMCMHFNSINRSFFINNNLFVGQKL